MYLYLVFTMKNNEKQSNLYEQRSRRGRTSSRGHSRGSFPLSHCNNHNNDTSMKNKSVIMQQSDAEPSQQSFYPNLAKAGLRPTGSLGQDTVFWCSQPTKLWKPTKTMINHETTLKNYGNQPKNMENHKTTLKYHRNQPKP